ncbi:hypothetical protein DPMN_029702 [Dreissena polymorpha]|uniref:Uncharacterized protein n=1 Tax=Dreissena polymorpha TaxID=45954 RepID=A0A9D4LYM2_DREPO|nr:hypothetical protein DPMN_029702 [Dreissena polymorpha]
MRNCTFFSLSTDGLTKINKTRNYLRRNKTFRLSSIEFNSLAILMIVELQNISGRSQGYSQIHRQIATIEDVRRQRYLSGVIAIYTEAVGVFITSSGNKQISKQVGEYCS